MLCHEVIIYILSPSTRSLFIYCHPQRGHYLYTLLPSTRSLFIYCHPQRGHYLYTVTLNVVIIYILSPSTRSLFIYCQPQRGHYLYTVSPKQDARTQRPVSRQNARPSVSTYIKCKSTPLHVY